MDPNYDDSDEGMAASQSPQLEENALDEMDAITQPENTVKNNK